MTDYIVYVEAFDQIQRWEDKSCSSANEAIKEVIKDLDQETLRNVFGLPSVDFDQVNVIAHPINYETMEKGIDRGDGEFVPVSESDIDPSLL